MSRNSVRIAVAGAGLIGRRHVDVIERSSDAQLASIVDPHERAASFAAERNVPWYRDIADMLAASPPDGVVLATPNQIHVDGGLPCVAAGIPILVEKPIADTVDKALRLVLAAEAADVPVLVGHHRRHNPIIHDARQKIMDGSIGDIVAVHATCWLYKPDDYFDVDWRTQKGAGPVFINLIHDIDLLRHLVGEVQSVQAIEANHTRGHAIEDSAAIILRFQSGALGTVTVSDTIVAPWSWELTAAENPAYPATGQGCYLVGGTKGSLDIPRSVLWTQKERSWWLPIDGKRYESGNQDPLDLQITHFCRVITEGEQPLASGREGLKSLQVIEAIKKAAVSGQTVDLGS